MLIDVFLLETFFAKSGSPTLSVKGGKTSNPVQKSKILNFRPLPSPKIDFGIRPPGYLSLKYTMKISLDYLIHGPGELIRNGNLWPYMLTWTDNSKAPTFKRTYLRISVIANCVASVIMLDLHSSLGHV